jgi:hypothetical protein
MEGKARMRRELLGPTSILQDHDPSVVETALPDLPIVVLLHNCLLSQGSPFNLLSVSQVQASARNSVDFSVGAPTLTVVSRKGSKVIPLAIQDGLYGFRAEPLHPNDDRYRTLHRYHLTARTDALADSTHGCPALLPPALPVPTDFPTSRGIMSSHPPGAGSSRDNKNISPNAEDGERSRNADDLNGARMQGQERIRA